MARKPKPPPVASTTNPYVGRGSARPRNRKSKTLSPPPAPILDVWSRIPGTARNYVNRDTGTILSRRAFAALPKSVQTQKLIGDPQERFRIAKRDRLAFDSQIRDFITEQKKRGVKFTPDQVRKDPFFQRIQEALELRTRAGKVNQGRAKWALKQLGRRDGLPDGIRVGDSGKKHVRDEVTGRWYPKQ